MGRDNLVRSLQGKESVAINLKDPRGQEMVHRLVARADAFVHNFRAGVPERLGVDWQTLREVNPRLVYQYGAAYGSTGPYRRQPAIDHVIAAFAGTTAHQAGDGEVPLKEQGADPVSSLGVGVSLLLGLRARDRTGDGQYVESAMIQSNLHMNIEDALDYHGKPARRRADRLQRGTGPTHRLYETAAPGLGYPTGPWVNPAARWIFLSVVEDDDFDRFCTAADRGDLMADRRFATRGAASETVRRSRPIWRLSSRRGRPGNGKAACSERAWGAWWPTKCPSTGSSIGARRPDRSRWSFRRSMPPSEAPIAGPLRP